MRRRQHHLIELAAGRLLLFVRAICIGRLRFGSGFALLQRGDEHGARREHQPCRNRHMTLADMRLAFEGGQRPRGLYGEDRSIERGDAERERGAAQCFDGLIARNHLRQPLARHRDLIARDLRRQLSAAHTVQLHMEGEPVEQGRGRMLLTVDALIKRHHAEPRRESARQPVALEHDLAAVHGARDPRRGRGRQALGERDQQHAAIDFGEQATLGDRPAGPQRRREVEPTQQAVVGDMRRQPADRRAGRQEAAQ